MDRPLLSITDTMSIIPNSHQTPNIYIDRLLPLLTDAEARALWYVTRQILGFRIPHDEIGSRQLAQGKKVRGEQVDSGAGLSIPAAQKALAGLVEFGVLIEEAPATRNQAPKYDLQLSEKEINWEGLQARKAQKKRKRRRQTEKARSVKLITPPDQSNRSPTDQLDRSPTDQLDRSHEILESHEREKEEGSWVLRKGLTVETPEPPTPRSVALAKIRMLVDQPYGLLKKRREETGRQPTKQDWQDMEAWAVYYLDQMRCDGLPESVAAGRLYNAIKNAEPAPAPKVREEEQEGNHKVAEWNQVIS